MILRYELTLLMFEVYAYYALGQNTTENNRQYCINIQTEVMQFDIGS